MIEPPVPATYVNVTLSAGRASKVAVKTILLLINSTLGLSVFPSNHFTNLYPELGAARFQICDPGVRFTYFFPVISTPSPSNTFPEPAGETSISNVYPAIC